MPTNFITNPSAEVDTAGWAKAGSVTLSRVTSLPGNPPANVTTGFQATISATSTATVDAGYTTVAVDRAAPLVGSVWMYYPEGWTGGPFRVRPISFTGGTGESVKIAPVALGAWQQVSFQPYTPDAADLTGIFSISSWIGDQWTGGESIYFTAASLSEVIPSSTSSVLRINSPHVGPLRVGKA